MPTAVVRQFLFIDIVGFSKLHGLGQLDTIDRFDAFVRATPEFKRGVHGTLTALPTGDGCLLAFDDIEAPIRCAVAIARAVNAMKVDARIGLRMGIHSGTVYDRTGLNDLRNFAGPGANVAQRVMNLGDAGHILISEMARALLSEYQEDWRTALTEDQGAKRVELGSLVVKHGEEVRVHNLWGGDFGTEGPRSRWSSSSRPHVQRRSRPLGGYRSATRATARSRSLWTATTPRPRRTPRTCPRG